MTILPANMHPKFLYTAISLCCCFFVLTASGQLQANFTADKSGGCSPLTVKFTNTTTGASTAAVWQWTFGNSNSSAFKDAAATYYTEKTYTVTLSVKDGAATSSKTIDIVVYKKPTVDFTVAPPKGCTPLDVTFTANATAGDGTITNYLWDFGDGVTIQGSNYNTIKHNYTFPQTPPITLNVTNSYGCYTPVTKNNQVDVTKGVEAIFKPSATTLCNTGESITFLNTSTGAGTLTYQWDFGDNQTSTDISPVHQYTKKGNYVVTLIVSSSAGCSSTVKSDVINVANFAADFTYPATLCLNQYINFTNTSTKPFEKAEWNIDNSPYSYNSYDGNYTTSFYQGGEHTIQLVVYYGGCTDTITKKITVNKPPQLNGFTEVLQGACGVPVTIKYTDTTSDAVAWKWQNSYYGNIFAETKNASFTYTSGYYEYVYLTVTNAAGCSSGIGKYINYGKPDISISITNSSPNQGCTGLTMSFAASPDTAVTEYKWNFGDNSPLSTEKNPTHSFTKGGNYVVTLDYTTRNGCKGTAYYNNITVVDKPKFDFTGPVSVCGNKPVVFTATPAATGWYYYWSFNEEGYYSGYDNSIIKQFNYDTTYTVKMIVYNNGCRDTVTKETYIKVLPPFPHIQQVLNTCDGTRGDVRFTETSKKALAWSWDFGDSGSDNYTAFKDTIRHTYNATKAYKVVLSATNGACTVRDSTTAYVLLKQKPLLTAEKTDACGSDKVNFKLSGFELNPYNYYNSNYYYLSNKEYSDLTTCNGLVYTNNNYWQQELNGTIESLDPGKTGLRMITSSYFFGCTDTSNFIPVKIHGPIAGFKTEPHSGCFKDALVFTDTTKTFGNIPIVKWEWDFGDNKTQTLTAKGPATHTYTEPGYYYVRLKVTDADGCSNQSDYGLHYTLVGGPKADFYASSYNIPPNTTVYLTNSSSFYNYYYNSSLQWIFPDSTTSADANTSFKFTKEGAYPVQLITKNSQTGCTDTITKIITVRKVNSVFTYTLSYINSNACPPVIASFKSVSVNAVRVAWDFGDGGIAGNQQQVSHTYNKPGIYRVVHYSYDSNNAVDSTEDFIEIKGPYALLKADVLTGCSSLQVKLTADVKYASEYTWDFGDGTVVPTTDTFAVHKYLTPGIYVPALILKNPGGCTATSELPDKVIVDSLSASFKIAPSIICDAGLSIFTPLASSLSNDNLQAAIDYTWVVTEGAKAETSHSRDTSHFFSTPGTHKVLLLVATPYGCSRQITDSVFVREGVTAGISGAEKICTGATVAYSGTASPANNALQWKWNFPNGNFSENQYPAAQQFTTTGTQQISLVVNNGYCSDTVFYQIKVTALPVVGFTPASPFVCKGSSIQLMAGGGIGYQWTAAVPINNPTAAAINTNNNTSIFYTVKITDAEGCSNKDSVLVKVIDPVKLKTVPSLFACQGTPLQLTVSGADKYKWIGNTAGISNLNIANPVALPNTSVTYTVVGYDNYNCFTDTAAVFVRISVLPLADAGPGKQLIAGMSYTLMPTVTGAVKYMWSPADYLGCTDCVNPVSTPESSTTYTLTAFNADGCKASDTVSIKLICTSNLVFIPKAFSPNGDNKNDRFIIKGSGVKSLHSVSIFSRWGRLLYQRKNVRINDRSNSWDGYANGEPMPAGAYVYSIQTECEAGDIFEYRGTVMIVR
jgi:gliding motility-associated-like protein